MNPPLTATTEYVLDYLTTWRRDGRFFTDEREARRWLLAEAEAGRLTRWGGAAWRRWDMAEVDALLRADC
ncbi:hypothetical protein [Streptomyces sp. AM 3-1-1]|uniref:hypothetical protein n=1 Tax=Streptomyces sp. AM 3-1-1 TaxID=3028711 RepID=UPI0023B8D8BF|nr:hypothetical protein [Streptomyces sp. AM 3-1-1]WEH30121.1 hypothetical protein P0D76_23925 [Streptomyces sp. AM 3-1-1]